MNKLLVPLAVVTLATSLITFGNGAAQAADVMCGDTIITDTKLHADINCFVAPGSDGIMIGAHGVTLNLNGFTIAGDPSFEASGVFNAGWDKVTIKNGAISGFQDGIRADDVTDLDIKDLTFADQRLSSIVVINSADVSIKRTSISQPPGGGGGFAEAIRFFHVYDAKVVDTTVDGGVFGLLSLGDPAVATELVIKDNDITNTTDGIFLLNTTDSRIVRNRVYENGSVGISLADDSIGNKIRKNTVTGNGAFDLAHDEGSSPNKWAKNTCGTSDGSDIDCP